MNKMFLKILVILGFIAPIGASAGYKRVDSPGVAQRKLNLLIKQAREMSDAERQQALADLSPSLREDYEDMLANMPERSQGKFKNAFNTINVVVTSGDVDNKELNRILEVVSEEEKLSPEQKQELVIVSEALLKEKNETVATEEKSEVPTTEEVRDEEKGKEEVEETAPSELSQYLSELREYFDKQLTSKKVAWFVNNIVSKNTNRFEPQADYKKSQGAINDFFIQLQKYHQQSDQNITCIQKAFSVFFHVTNKLYVPLEEQGIKKDRDTKNLFAIMEKGNNILKAMPGRLAITSILNKEETSNKNRIIAETEQYKEFAWQFGELQKALK